MKRGDIVATAILAGGAVVGAGCGSMALDSTDDSPPVVELLVQRPNGLYAVARKATLAPGGKLKVLCRVSDRQGVKRVGLAFAGANATRCTVGGSAFDGVFPLHPPPPADAAQDISGSAHEAPITVPLFAEVNDATCAVDGQAQAGRPLGHEIVATCSGMNWSADPARNQATAKLAITIR